MTAGSSRASEPASAFQEPWFQHLPSESLVASTGCFKFLGISACLSRASAPSPRSSSLPPASSRPLPRPKAAPRSPPPQPHLQPANASRLTLPPWPTAGQRQPACPRHSTEARGQPRGPSSHHQGPPPLPSTPLPPGTPTFSRLGLLYQNPSLDSSPRLVSSTLFPAPCSPPTAVPTAGQRQPAPPASP